METRTYRAAPGAYANFGAVTGTIAILWLFAVWHGGAPWKPVLVPALGFGVVALWLSGFRLTIATSGVIYGQLFRRLRRFPLDEILTVEFAEVTRFTESPRTLCVRLISGEELRLNARVFPRAAIASLLAIGQKARAQASR